MKLGDLTELASQNLREAMLRNSLTTVGIAVGVASLVAMLSLGVGLQQLINRRLERTGLFDSVLVRPGNAFGAPAQGGGGFPGGRRLAQPAAPAAPLDETARQKLAQLPHVGEVYPEFRFTGDLRFGPNGRVAQIASLPSSASSNDGLEGMQGHFFSSSSAHEVILQLNVATDLADAQHLKPGDLISKEVVMRYAGRQPLAPGTSESAPSDAGEPSPD